MRHGLLLVSLLMIASQAANGETPSGEVAEIVSKVERREARLGSHFYVEWKVEEKIRPEALDRAPMDIAGADDPEHELNLKRTNFLAWDNRNWRIDSKGLHLHRDRPAAAFQAVERHFTHVQRAGVAHEMYAGSADGANRRGQIFSSRFEEDDAFLNDIANLPLALFIRPSSVMLFRNIKKNEYEIIANALGNRDNEKELCLRDKRYKTHFFWFRPDTDYVCTRLQVGPRLRLEIAYAEFDDFGMAPKSWTCTQLLEDGTVGRSWNATVLNWHARRAEILPLVNFQFPAGTKITDLRSPPSKGS